METLTLPKIVSIVPTFNGQDFIVDCLKSLESGSLKCNILVVDNASIDKTVSTIEENFKEVKIIKNPKNLGFGRALNLGFSYGKEKGYDYILILNQDAELETNTLFQMANFAQLLKPEDWAFISPWNKDSHGNTEYYFEDNLNKRSGGHSKIFIPEFEVIPVDFINAACWLINAKALEKLKGFDKRFFMYGEDLDFCNRAKYLGFKMFVMQNVYCVHHKVKGDYESNEKKLIELKIGEELAWYLTPGISMFSKILKFVKISLVCLKLFSKGNFFESRQKFQINTQALFMVFRYITQINIK